MKRGLTSVIRGRMMVQRRWQVNKKADQVTCMLAAEASACGGSSSYDLGTLPLPLHMRQRPRTEAQTTQHHSTSTPPNTSLTAIRSTTIATTSWLTTLCDRTSTPSASAPPPSATLRPFAKPARSPQRSLSSQETFSSSSSLRGSGEMLRQQGNASRICPRASST